MPPKQSKPKFNEKDLVLAKMSGFPAWPSFVMPPDMIPPAIYKVQKKSTNYCVIFIPDGDYNWMTEKQLELLTTEKLDARLLKIPKSKLANPKPKSGRTKNVADALLAARDLDFDEFMEQLEVNEDEDEEEEEEDTTNDIVDEAEPKKEEQASEADDEDDDEEEEVRPSKRNRQPVATLKVAKSESRRTRSSPLDTNGADNETSSVEPEASPKTAHAHRRTPSNGVPNKVSKSLTNEEKQHQLWLCRIKLQRSLIQRNQPVTPADTKQYPPPTVDELSVARLILHRLVDFPVTVELLKTTKIHKVLKCIIKDEDLEYPDSFKLHEKCEELLSKWAPMIDSLKLDKARANGSPAPDGVNGHKTITKLRLGSLPPEELEVSAVEATISSKGKVLGSESDDDVKNGASPIQLEAHVATVEG